MASWQVFFLASTILLGAAAVRGNPNASMVVLIVSIFYGLVAVALRLVP